MKHFLGLGLSVTLAVLALSFLLLYLIGLSYGVSSVVAAPESSKGERTQSASVSSNWLVEVVDTNNEWVGADNSLALDKANQPHIAYSDPVSGDLKYARFGGTVWQTETVDAPGSVGWSPSLALDEFDQPHISYIDATNNALKYASYTGSSWQTETVDSAYHCCTALVLDKSHHPHISYYTLLSPTVNYAWYNGVVWEKETITVTMPAFDPRDISLKLDNMDRPHIIYHLCYNSSCEVKHTWYDGSQWLLESVEGAQSFSLALDTSGRLHLSGAFYRDFPPGLTGGWLYYLRRDDMKWNEEAIARSFGQVSLALDAWDHPHIINYDGKYPNPREGSNFLRYYWYDGIVWHSEDMSNVGYWGQYNRNVSLALDTSGRPKVSYYDAVTHQLKYAQRWPMTLSQEAEPQEGLHQGDTLNYALTLDAPDQPVRFWDPLPSGTTYVSDSISSTLSPAAVYSPSVNAILWEGTLPSNTIQTIHFQVSANGIDTGALALPIVNTAWLTDTGNVRSVSVMIIVNAIKSYLPIIREWRN